MDPVKRTHVLEEFGKKTIFYPSFQHAYSQLQKAAESTWLRHTPTSAFLSADSGTGKSRLCEIFRDSFGPAEEVIRSDGIHRSIPALYCLVPAPITIKGLCCNLLHHLGQYPTHANTAVLTLQVIKRLQLAETKVVILDEIQRLLLPEAEKIRAGTLDWISTLLSLSGIAIVLSGTVDSKKLLNHDPAFNRRFGYLATLEYLRYSEDPTSEFHLILEGLDRELYQLGGLLGEVHLHDLTMKIAFYVATLGNLEYMRQIIHEAAGLCLYRDDLTLRRSDFADACYSLRVPVSLSKEVNPFYLSANESLLLIRNHHNEQVRIRAAALL